MQSAPDRPKKAICIIRKRTQHSKNLNARTLIRKQKSVHGIITGDMLVFSSAVMKCGDRENHSKHNRKPIFPS